MAAKLLSLLALRGGIFSRDQSIEPVCRDRLAEATCAKDLAAAVPNAVNGSASVASSQALVDAWELVMSTSQADITVISGNDVAVGRYLPCASSQGSSTTLDAVAVALAQRMSSLSPRAVCNTVETFAAVAHAPLELMDAVMATVEERVDEFEPRDLISVVKSLGVVQHSID